MNDEKKPHYIREWRKHRHLTQERLAERVGQTQGWVSQLERQEIGYTQGTLEALAYALSCEPSDLLAVNPFMAGEVVDLVGLLRRATPAQQHTVYELAKTYLQVGNGGLQIVPPEDSEVYDTSRDMSKEGGDRPGTTPRRNK